MYELGVKDSERADSALQRRIGDIATSINDMVDKHIEKTVDEMTSCAKKKCPSIFKRVEEDLKRGLEEKGRLEDDVVRNHVIETVGSEITNKVGTLNLTISTLISNKLTDTLLAELSQCNLLLTEHLSNTKLQNHYRSLDLAKTPAVSPTHANHDNVESEDLLDDVTTTLKQEETPDVLARTRAESLAKRQRRPEAHPPEIVISGDVVLHPDDMVEEDDKKTDIDEVIQSSKIKGKKNEKIGSKDKSPPSLKGSSEDLRVKEVVDKDQDEDQEEENTVTENQIEEEIKSDKTIKEDAEKTLETSSKASEESEKESIVEESEKNGNLEDVSEKDTKVQNVSDEDSKDEDISELETKITEDIKEEPDPKDEDIPASKKEDKIDDVSAKTGSSESSLADDDAMKSFDLEPATKLQHITKGRAKGPNRTSRRSARRKVPPVEAEIDNFFTKNVSTTDFSLVPTPEEEEPAQEEEVKKPKRVVGGVAMMGMPMITPGMLKKKISKVPREEVESPTHDPQPPKKSNKVHRPPLGGVAMPGGIFAEMKMKSLKVLPEKSSEAV